MPIIAYQPNDGRACPKVKNPPGCVALTSTLRVALRVTQLPRTHHDRFCPDIRSDVEVGKECVAVYGAKRDNKHSRDQLGWERIRPLVQVYYSTKQTAAEWCQDTHQDGRQNGKSGSPDTTVDREYGEAV